jgi:uncharacterized protein YbbK (DUF523 family)
MEPMGTAKLHALRDRLHDHRAGRVIFVSHCLLNENVRYLGGAARRGVVEELVERCRRQGLGICQMPCLEQRAWGGVLKRFTVPLYGSQSLERLAPVMWLLFRLYTRVVYLRMARKVAAEIADYQRSGFEVVGVVGVGVSPSCGVRTALDMRRTVKAIARCDISTLERTSFNRKVIANNVVAGEGLFTRELRRALRQRGIAIPFLEHDLIAELSGQRPVPLDLR